MTPSLQKFCKKCPEWFQKVSEKVLKIWWNPGNFVTRRISLPKSETRMDGGEPVCSAYFVIRLLLGSLDLTSDLVGTSILSITNPTTLIIINHAMQLTLSSAWSSLPWSPWSSLSCSTSSYLCFNIIVPIVVVVRKISWNQSPCPLSIIFTTILISIPSSSSPSLAGAGITLASLRPLRMGWSNIWLDPRWFSRRNHHRARWTVRISLKRGIFGWMKKQVEPWKPHVWWKVLPSQYQDARWGHTGDRSIFKQDKRM